MAEERDAAGAEPDRSDSALLDPVTGRPFRHAKLLFFLADIVAERRILRAMIEAGCADYWGLTLLASELKLTARTKGDEGMSEQDIAGYILAFLFTRKVRVRVVHHVTRHYGISRHKAARDLQQLQVECEEILKPCGLVVLH